MVDPNETSYEEVRHPAGILASVRALVGNVLALAQTHLELITTEIEEEIQGAVSLLTWVLVALMFAGLGVVMVAVLILTIFWDDHRILAASLLTAGFLVAAAIAAYVAVARLKSRRPFLAASIEELKRDREALERGP